MDDSVDINAYFNMLSEDFDAAYAIATKARNRGFDPETFVEIKPAPDLASRVEGILNVEGLADLIRSKSAGQSNRALAFDIVRDLCINPKFKKGTVEDQLTLALRAGLSILTDGVLVAPTEGIQGVKLHKNPDGSTYAAVVYAGPIRGAGGTAAALSVGLADLGRQILGIDNYKPQPAEVDRYLEEIDLYDSRITNLQYRPSDEDTRVILENCPVCIDGLATHDMEIGVHRNVKRLDADGKEEIISNKIRGALGLVICEGIAQKAKNVLKYTKAAGLDWGWLNNVIKVSKQQEKGTEKSQDKKSSVFLQDLVGGRPILSYPDARGAFRLRYGRSRLTGIAAKGFSPATMIILDEFIATGTQVKVESPGKGCIAMPVDSIEGPFVKLSNGEAFRVNSAEKANEVRSLITKILSVGDMLVTYGDFKKTNTPLLPSSYVEEYWYEQLKEKGYEGSMPKPANFKEAFELSKRYGVPMHPLYIYDYSDLDISELRELARGIAKADVDAESVFAVRELKIKDNVDYSREAVEKLCVPHYDDGATIILRGSDAQSLLMTLGFAGDDGRLTMKGSIADTYSDEQTALEAVNAHAPYMIMRRATRLGGRIGRPEKAKERLMKPAPNLLFPIGEYGGKERNLYKAYIIATKKFGDSRISAEVVRYRCPVGKEIMMYPYCREHKVRGVIEKVCKRCGKTSKESVCPSCGGPTSGSETQGIDLISMINEAVSNLDRGAGIPRMLKGVKGLSSADKIVEPIEKGVLRSMNGVYIFKDGTARFDATDAPITHFYPDEIGLSVERARELGYEKDFEGNELTSGNQLVELRHQDVIINSRAAEYMARVASFIDQLLVDYYKLEPYYGISSKEGLIGQLVITLSPHTSAGVLGRIIGFTDAKVGLAHPYTISARRRNCDGDEDTMMLLLDALINFSKRYLPTTVGGTMDAPLILSVKVHPEEVDDEVHEMETVSSYGLKFYEDTLNGMTPPDVKVDIVADRLKSESIYSNLMFTHSSSARAIADAPKQSVYTKLKTMQEKVELQFRLMDKLESIDKADSAKRLIMSHFIPDLIGNLHSFSKQTFRCIACNAKYRRVPLSGVCTRCGGKLVLTISKGGIEKYLIMATDLADRYNIEPYIKQRLALIREEIENVFGGVGAKSIPTRQFNLSTFM